MKEFVNIFKKVNGWSIIKEYIRYGYIFYAFLHVFINGLSKKSLELLRLGVNLKKYRKIKKKYFPILKEIDKKYSNRNIIENRQQDKIWICWFQGIENAPYLVQCCYKSIKRNIKDKEIVLITETNRKDFINLPEFIEKKYEKGKISKTHLSDILRVALLAEYGGTWIDATVLCTSDTIPDYMLNSDFFMFQNLKPGSDGDILNISSWFITSQKENKIIMSVRDLLYTYWSKNNSLLDYFLVHYFFILTQELYKEEWNKVIPFSNSTPHILLLRLFDEYDEECYNEIIRQTPFHKLAYKRSSEDFSKKGTYYDIIFNSIHL